MKQLSSYEFLSLLSSARRSLRSAFSEYIERRYSVDTVPYKDIIGRFFPDCSISSRDSLMTENDYTIVVKVSNGPFWCCIILYCYCEDFENGFYPIFDIELI